MGSSGHGFNVEDVSLRVGDCFGEEEFRVVLDRSLPLVGVMGVGHESHLDAEFAQGVGEEVVGATVKGGGGDNVVAGFCDVEDCEGGCCLP